MGPATERARAPDYIRALNNLTDELLRSHSDLLGRKNVARKRELIRVIRLDLDKLMHALVEVKENRADEVLSNFFAGSVVDYKSVCGKLSGERIYHVGLEIHEPLGLLLPGIQHWIEYSAQVLGARMRIRNFLRFPASLAFQARVGAETEIMRIWIEVDGETLMLELFDIYRAVDPMLASAPASTYRNFHGLFRPENSASSHGEGLTRLFADDEIWHYAFQVDKPEDVMELHTDWQRLAQSNPAYYLPYEVPVHNQQDHSFHTKIIRLPGQRLELEFVTQLPAAPICLT